MNVQAIATGLVTVFGVVLVWVSVVEYRRDRRWRLFAKPRYPRGF